MRHGYGEHEADSSLPARSHSLRRGIPRRRGCHFQEDGCLLNGLRTVCFSHLHSQCYPCSAPRRVLPASSSPLLKLTPLPNHPTPPPHPQKPRAPRHEQPKRSQDVPRQERVPPIRPRHQAQPKAHIFPTDRRQEPKRHANVYEVRDGERGEVVADYAFQGWAGESGGGGGTEGGEEEEGDEGEEEVALRVQGWVSIYSDHRWALRPNSQLPNWANPIFASTLGAAPSTPPVASPTTVLAYAALLLKCVGTRSR